MSTTWILQELLKMPVRILEHKSPSYTLSQRQGGYQREKSSTYPSTKAKKGIRKRHLFTYPYEDDKEGNRVKQFFAYPSTKGKKGTEITRILLYPFRIYEQIGFSVLGKKWKFYFLKNPPHLKFQSGIADFSHYISYIPHQLLHDAGLLPPASLHTYSFKSTCYFTRIFCPG